MSLIGGKIDLVRIPTQFTDLPGVSLDMTGGITIFEAVTNLFRNPSEPRRTLRQSNTVSGHRTNEH